MTRAVAAAVALVALVGCAALADDLGRAEHTYEQARYEESLVWLTALERDTPDMSLDQRAEFYYLRGMTAYRLQQRDDALHYLALAREVSGEHTDALRQEWRSTLDRTLDELTPTQRTHHARDPNAPVEASAGGDNGAEVDEAPGG